MEQENNIFLSIEQNSENSLRLDKFLTSKLDLSRAEIQRLIKGGNVFVDEEEITDCAYKTRLGDTFEIDIPQPIEATPKAQNIELNIVYEDNDLIVLNKPAGMVVHPGAGVYEGTLVNALLYHCRDSLSGIGGVKRPGIVHRIDKETSGLLVVAKNDTTHLGLSEQFSKHSIKRTYFAFVYGTALPSQGTIEGNIGRSKFDRKKMALLKMGGKEAITHYKTIENFSNFASLIKCQLETGRTHQIRVHLSSIGHHLIGDKVYTANSRDFLKVPSDIRAYVQNFHRQALHAATLGFIHPSTKKELLFETDLPSDLQELKEKLSTTISF